MDSCWLPQNESYQVQVCRDFSKVAGREQVLILHQPIHREIDSLIKQSAGFAQKCSDGIDSLSKAEFDAVEWIKAEVSPNVTQLYPFRGRI